MTWRLDVLLVTIRTDIDGLCFHNNGLFSLQSVHANDFRDLFGVFHVINRSGLSRRQTVDSDTPPPTPPVHDFIDSRASLQFARRPSFVSGKRGVTFFRAMFVDRSGVQIAVQLDSHTPRPPQHWKSKRAPGGGIQTLPGQGDPSSQKFYSTKKHVRPYGFVTLNTAHITNQKSPLLPSVHTL